MSHDFSSSLLLRLSRLPHLQSPPLQLILDPTSVDVSAPPVVPFSLNVGRHEPQEIFPIEPAGNTGILFAPPLGSDDVISHPMTSSNTREAAGSLNKGKGGRGSDLMVSPLNSSTESWIPAETWYEVTAPLMPEVAFAELPPKLKRHRSGSNCEFRGTRQGRLQGGLTSYTCPSGSQWRQHEVPQWWRRDRPVLLQQL